MEKYQDYKKFNRFWWNCIILILSIFILYILLYFTEDIDPMWKYGKYLQNTIKIAIAFNYLFIIICFIGFIINIYPLLKGIYLIIRETCIFLHKRFTKKKNESESEVKKQENMF